MILAPSAWLEVPATGLDGVMPVSEAVLDGLQRPLWDLRVSVTDRCNFRCPYCMPIEAYGQDAEFLPREEILAYEEIVRLVTVMAPLGLRKVRLTGGEPLLRRELTTLIAALRAAVPGIELTLTTNGTRLAALAPALADAGLDRVTVSLDSLDPERYAAMSGVGANVAHVHQGLAAAAAAGLGPIRVNTVLRRGVNDDDVLPLLAFARDSPYQVRFIEYMDVGHTNGWRLDEVVPTAELLDRIAAEWPIEPIEEAATGRVARRWRFADGAGEFGVISSVTEPFCGGCTRARLSAEGRLHTCLFASGDGLDLRAALRDGSSDEALSERLREHWSGRVDRYSEHRGQATAATRPGKRIEMSYIGG